MVAPFKRSRVKDGKTIKSKTYSIKYKDERGEWMTETAYTDKQASAALLKQRETEIDRRRAGLAVVEDADRKQLWADVCNAFRRELVSKGSDPDGPHIRDVKCILDKVGTTCAWKTLAEVRRDRFSCYLASLASDGKSAQTRKNHLAITRSLLNWCVAQKWLAESPLAGLQPPRVGQAGKVRIRRAYTHDEFDALMRTTPEPRRTLYLIAALSGYRRSELGLMEKRDISPEGDRPHWKLRATVDKTGRCDLVPIVSDILPTVRRLWSALPSATSRLVRDGLGCAVPRCETLRSDLARAGIEAIDDQGRHADFHSFRYTFCKFASEVLPIQFVKVLMRHATFGLTVDLYGQLGLIDVGEKVWNLPPLLRRDYEGKEHRQQTERPEAEQDQPPAENGQDGRKDEG